MRDTQGKKEEKKEQFAIVFSVFGRERVRKKMIRTPTINCILKGP
jgi:hypothetical protein